MGDVVKSKMKQALQAYDKIAKLYANYKNDKLLQYQLNKFISLLPGKKILDAGCGTGRDMQYFTDEGMEAVGIDLSRGMLEEAMNRVPAGIFIQMDFSKTKFKEASFDGIWSMASLSDIPREQAKKVLKEFSRILKKSGIVYTAVKRGQGEEVVRKRKYNDMPRAYVYYEKIELEDLFQELGFQIVHSIISEDDGQEWVEIFARKI